MSKISELFANATDNVDLARRWDDFQKSMMEAPNTAKGDRVLTNEGSATVLAKTEAPSDQMTRLLGSDSITKALGADTIASISAQLEQAGIQKDLTLTSPLSTGYVAYDLEAPAKLLFPKPTPIRNRIPRGRGVGVAHQFKKIDGISGTQGGPAPLRPGISDSTTTSFGSLSLNRGPKISYQGSETTVPYLQFGLSDSVPFSAQFAGQGFMDARSVSQSAVLYASMLSEERLMLGGRGTASGFQGAFAAPTGVSVASRAAVAGETGLSGVTTNVFVKVTALSVFGESTLSSAANVATSNGNVVDVTITGEPVGTLGYNVYISTGAGDPGDSARWRVTTFQPSGNGYNVVTVGGPLPTSGVAANTISADTSASAQDYDGILTICAAQGGYTKRLNATFSTSNPSNEFQTAFAAMYALNLADPDEVLMNGYDRKQLSDLLKIASSTGFRITVPNGPGDNTIGSVVTGLVNEVTGKMVDLTVHPYLPQGNAPILSHTLPFPDSNVDDLWVSKNVQDYMAMQWPVIQNSYDTSSYWFGTFYCYAPKWQGIIQGIKRA